MRIYPEQLPQSLASGISPVYFISGDETLLVEEACALIRSKAYELGISVRDVFEVTKHFPWDNFSKAAGNLSLFGDRKLIELRLDSVKLDAFGITAIKNYCAHDDSSDVLLIIAPKLEAGWQKIGWLKKIEESAVFLQVWPIEAKQFPEWIFKRLKQRGLMADADACKLLAEKVEGNLLAANQEIEKLALLYGAGKITVAEMLDTIANSAHYNIFNLVDYALSGDLKKTIVSCDVLQKEAVEPILVLWSLARELRNLIKLAKAKEQGILENAIQEQRILTKRIPIIKAALSRHSVQNLITMLQHSFKIDLMIKGVSPGNTWRELLQLALNLAEKHLVGNLA